VKKWPIALIVVLGVLGLYQWSVIRGLRAELDDTARVRQACQALVPNRDELSAAALWLHQFYQSPEGLQRPQGLWIGDRPDFEGISAWILDTYVWARVEGATPDEAKDRIVKTIQGAEEWKLKHPGGVAK
jgi:hypothetical protein